MSLLKLFSERYWLATTNSAAINYLKATNKNTENQRRIQNLV